MVIGIIGIYGTLIFLGTRGGSKKKTEEAAPAAAPGAASSDEIMSILDDGFDEWSKLPGNLDKYAASFEKME